MLHLWKTFHRVTISHGGAGGGSSKGKHHIHKCKEQEAPQAAELLKIPLFK